MPLQNEQGEDAQLHNAILAEGDDNAAVAVANEWLREHGLAELPIPQSWTDCRGVNDFLENASLPGRAGMSV